MDLTSSNYFKLVVETGCDYLKLVHWLLKLAGASSNLLLLVVETGC